MAQESSNSICFYKVGIEIASLEHSDIQPDSCASRWWVVDQTARSDAGAERSVKLHRRVTIATATTADMPAKAWPCVGCGWNHPANHTFCGHCNLKYADATSTQLAPPNAANAATGNAPVDQPHDSNKKANGWRKGRADKRSNSRSNSVRPKAKVPDVAGTPATAGSADTLVSGDVDVATRYRRA